MQNFPDIIILVSAKKCIFAETKETSKLTIGKYFSCGDNDNDDGDTDDDDDGGACASTISPSVWSVLLQWGFIGLH